MIFDNSKLGGVVPDYVATIRLEHAALEIIACMIRIRPSRSRTAILMR